LVRLTLELGEGPAKVAVAVGKERRGRSAYLCPRQACLDRALQRRALARAFRVPAVVDEETIRAAIRVAEAER
jgi:predicted RNA-binding protein YlxR (DUF448 family)